MQISIAHPIFQTIIFAVVLGVVFLCTLRRKKGTELFPLETTNELKGFAILAILLGHIAYSLFQHQTFLFPLSVFAGMGVDLFLFLSGFGLACSALKTQLSRKEFYEKRLGKIFFSLWIVLFLFFVIDFFALDKTYPLREIISSFFGFFPRADLTQNINSPLWYITFILFYYLIFPWVFNKNHPVFSSVGLYILTWLLLQLTLPLNPSVKHLYELHAFAFPLGVAFSAFLPRISPFLFEKKSPIISLLVICATVLLLYFGIHSGVGKEVWLEQGISLLLVFFILVIFILKQFEFRFLSLLGTYSHEIYLLHWPIMSRYDFLYTVLPAGVATLLYVGIFLCLGFSFSWILKKFARQSKIKQNTP